MANNVSQKGVLVLDTAADNIVAAAVPVKVRACKFVGIAAGQATITDAGGSVAKIEMSAVQNGTDVQYFDPPLVLAGLRLLAITATDRVYVYAA